MDGLVEEDEASDYEGEEAQGKPKAKGKRNPKAQEEKARKGPKQRKKPVEFANPNVIKTFNKLIGEIENKDLYNSDDDQ